MANPVTGYPNRKTKAQLALLTPATVAADFRVGLTYYRARPVGVESDGGSPEVFSERYVLEAVTVRELYIEQDLLDFRNETLKGNAFKSNVPATTV